MFLYGRVSFYRVSHYRYITQELIDRSISSINMLQHEIDTVHISDFASGVMFLDVSSSSFFLSHGADGSAETGKECDLYLYHWRWDGIWIDMGLYTCSRWNCEGDVGLHCRSRHVYIYCIHVCVTKILEQRITKARLVGHHPVTVQVQQKYIHTHERVGFFLLLMAIILIDVDVYVESTFSIFFSFFPFIFSLFLFLIFFCVWAG